MKQCNFTVVVVIIVSFSAFAQNYNLLLKSSVYYSGQTCAGVWGHVDSLGNEYALVGASQGMAIVNIANPVSPFKVIQIPGPNNKWKEIRTFGKYAYVTNELDSGLQIINLSNLPGTILSSKYWKPVIDNQQLKSIHALEISDGYLYLHGSNIDNGGTLIIDIADPWNPVYIGIYDTKYVHDGYVRNDTLYAANIRDGYFSVINVSNKANPVLLATQNTPHNYTHNTWFSDNSKVLFTTDEVNGSYLTAYDISNLGNITELDRIQSNPGNGAILHNVYLLNEWAVASCNADGINIIDAHRPGNLVHVGSYDTYTAGSGGGFTGVWGAYPFLPSGNILAASRDGYLHVLAPTYVRACYLEGIVTDSITTNPINTVAVRILTTPVIDSTKFTGNYAIGSATPGVYTIEYSKVGYVTQSRSAVLSPGVVTVLNVKLSPLSNAVNAPFQESSYMTMYPNPFNSSINIKYRFANQVKSDARMVVTDRVGRIVYIAPLYLQQGTITMNNNLSVGSYLIHFFNGKESLKPFKIINAGI